MATRFDVIGSSYNNSLIKFANARNQDLIALINKADVSVGMNIMDYAAGSGFVTLPLAEMVGNEGSILAVDISKVMLDLLRNKAQEIEHNNINYLCTNNPNLDEIPDNSFDCIVSLGGWHHVEQQINVCQSFMRLLKPSGRAVIMDFKDDSPVQRHFDRTIHKYTSTGHKALFLSLSHAENLARYAGFDSFSCEHIKSAWQFDNAESVGEFMRIHHGLSIDDDKACDLALDIFQPRANKDMKIDLIIDYVVLVLEK
jgi:ubiquinone/menaquinone biosynthesis C-methylase UbiE